MIAQTLTQNTSLSKLDLRGNELGSQGITALCKAMESSSLTELNLSLTNVENEDGKTIGAMLKKNETLKVLDLSNNSMRVKF